ncbi:MAG: hypothetical protein IJI54_01455 [Kiritimatiellae bacterium]|nr:hypothetical protein [Kiritimatiellia bacterium]
MDGKFNTPRTVCKAIVAVAIAAVAVAAIIGCESIGGGTRKQNIATVIQTAYDLGGREAVSNKIESLVAEGKLTPSQAVRLHALAQLAYEGIMDDLTTGDAATNATPTSASQGGCGDCSIPDASGDCGGGGCTDACSDCQPDAASDGGCNADANCGNCTDCKAQR